MKHSRETSLQGLWRFRTDPENLGEHFAQQLDIPWQYDARWMRDNYDDRDWAEIKVPGCWQEAGYAYNGAAWYRKTFNRPAGHLHDHRYWLRFAGVDYFADIWLNEHYLGSHEGYFTAFQYEISSFLKDEDNLLVVKVDSPNDINPREDQIGQLKKNIKGALQRWDANNPEVNPGGIWNEVTVAATGPGTIEDVQVRYNIMRLPEHPSSDETVPVTAVVGVTTAGFSQLLPTEKAQLRLTITPIDFEGDQVEVLLPITILGQSCQWQLPVQLDQARLWYTWDIGRPHRYQVRVRLELDGQISDEVSQTLGFRQLERKEGWETYLNGIRFFQRGANYLSDQFLSSMTPARYERDVHLLREANLNTVHPFCVVEKPAFYDLCDHDGLLVYQDFPMWLMMDNSGDLVRRAMDQLLDLITQYGHHPSIFVWNFGSQASIANFEKLGAALENTARHHDPTRLIQRSNALVDIGTPDHFPSDPVGTFHWTEGTVADFQGRYDWRIDTHQYRGWYSKGLDSVSEIPSEHLELVTEYGAQGMPSREMLEQFIPDSALFPPDWPFYTRRCFQPEYQFNYIDEPTSLEQFIADSQSYQAQFLQLHTEYYRRHKFDPCNGAHMFCFNDCWPAITWSVVDYDRRRKAGFHALRRAMAPLQVLLEPVFDVRVGQRIEQALWIVNDFPNQFDDLKLTWRISADDDQEPVAEGSQSVTATENSVVKLERIMWVPTRRSTYAVALTIKHHRLTLAENFYQFKAAA